MFSLSLILKFHEFGTSFASKIAVLQKARIVSLSGVPEMECLEDSAVGKLKLNHLMPGTLLSVSPVKSTVNGVYVDIGNGKLMFLPFVSYIG